MEPLLRARPDLVQVLEIEPQTTWVKTADPERPYRVDAEVLEHLSGLPGRKLVHSVGTPVGGSVRPDQQQLRLLRAMVERFESPWRATT